MKEQIELAIPTAREERVSKLVHHMLLAGVGELFTYPKLISIAKRAVAMGYVIKE